MKIEDFLTLIAVGVFGALIVITTILVLIELIEVLSKSPSGNMVCLIAKLLLLFGVMTFSQINLRILTKK